MLCTFRPSRLSPHQANIRSTSSVRSPLSSSEPWSLRCSSSLTSPHCIPADFPLHTSHIRIWYMHYLLPNMNCNWIQPHMPWQSLCSCNRTLNTYMNIRYRSLHIQAYAFRVLSCSRSRYIRTDAAFRQEYRICNHALSCCTVHNMRCRPLPPKSPESSRWTCTRNCRPLTLSA